MEENALDSGFGTINLSRFAQTTCPTLWTYPPEKKHILRKFMVGRWNFLLAWSPFLGGHVNVRLWGVGEAFNNFYWKTITGSWWKHGPKKVDHDIGRKSPASLRVSFLVKTSTQKPRSVSVSPWVRWILEDVQSQHESVLSRSSTVNLAGSGSWISLDAVFAGFWVKLMDGEVIGGELVFRSPKNQLRLLTCPPYIFGNKAIDCTRRSKCLVNREFGGL